LGLQKSCLITDGKHILHYVSSKIGYDAKLSRTFLYSQDNIFHINGK